MNIIRDTREKVGFYNFTSYNVNIVVRKLDTGDYSLEGYEKDFTIERKKTVAELCQNVTQKRFTNELKRLSLMKWPFIILEFTVEDVLDFPRNADLPAKIKNKIKVTGPYILRRIGEIMRDYRIPLLFCSNKYYAEEMTYSLMKRINDNG